MSPQRKVFYGTFSGKLVYSGTPNLWMRTQMPKGNWMVSISTWERMQETAQTSMCGNFDIILGTISHAHASALHRPVHAVCYVLRSAQA